MSKNLSDKQEPVLRVETIWADPDASLAYIALRGANQYVINHGSTTIYEVLSGNGTMVVDGVAHVLREGASIEAPKGVPYQDFGHVDMLATSTPPFDISMVEFLI